MDDLIRRSDAIDVVTDIQDGSGQRYYLAVSLVDKIRSLPSAEAPTVIRSKTLLPTKDFKEWAKRIREENPNAVIIPCDAEVVSAEATCATCADRAMCIMSEPDGNWKACKDYRPSAETVRAEWIDKGNWMGIECSRCKCHSRYVTPFCPQCGARMKGAKHEID